jgi:glycosyltransferase involved in cell wall biosynthesis/LPS sulfotransferase NodH
MRILWFTGVQLPAVTGKELARAGWQEGLRKALYEYHPEIHLSIASNGFEDYEPFTEENATYYSIYRTPVPDSRWKRAIKNWKHLTYDREELDRSLEIVEIVQPDLIFIFGTENPFGLLANRFPVPVVISIQAVINGLVQRIFHGLSFRELMQEFFTRDTIMGEGIFHRYWQLRILSTMEQLIYNRCIVFCGRTSWDYKWLTKLNRKAIYYHIDRILAEEYYQQIWKIEDSYQNIIFTTSSNAAFKGGITLTRALIKLVKRGRKDIQLHLAGIHPLSVVGKNINRLISKHKLQDNIKLLGRIQPNEIIQEMKQARIFVLPSHMDNSPNSLGEAMAVGLPCIASDAGGIPSMITDGENGLLYHHSDINALVMKIEELLDDPTKAERLGAKARETALERHDPEKISDITFNMYQEVISGQAQARTQFPEERISNLERMYRRIKLVYYGTRFGKLPEPENLINPYLSKKDLNEIKTIFPLEKFFIYGHARSGTTLLARLIRVHPEVHCNYQAHFFTRPPTIHSLVDSPIVREWLSRPENRWNQGKDLSPVVMRIVADYLMEREARKLGKSIVGDKSPNNIFDGKSVHKLYSIYPDAKLINIIRDGRDTVLSYRFQAFIDFQEDLDDEDSRIREDFIYHPDQFLNGSRSIFTRESLIQGTLSWVRNVEETESVGNDIFGKNFYSLKYEDLISNPLDEMDQVWEFLGVDLNFAQKKETILDVFTRNPDAEWQHHQARDLVANLKKGKSGGWREMFTDQDKEIFLEIAGDTLSAFGYETD